jgi:hypothetical protein
MAGYWKATSLASGRRELTSEQQSAKQGIHQALANLKNQKQMGAFK